MKKTIAATALGAMLMTSAAMPAFADPSDARNWSAGFGDPVQAMTSAKAAKRYSRSSGMYSVNRLDNILASIGKAKRKGVIGYVFRENRVNRTRIQKSNKNIQGIIRTGNVSNVNKTIDGYAVTYTNGGGSRTIMSGGGCAGQGCN